MFRLIRHTSLVIVVLSIMGVFQSCSIRRNNAYPIVYRSSHRRYVPDVVESNAIVLKAYYDGWWGHWAGPHPNSEWGPYIILKPTRYEYTAAAEGSYYASLRDNEEIGVWYTSSDTLVLIPSHKMLYYSSLYSRGRQKRFKVEKKGESVWSNWMPVRKYVFENKRFLRQTNFQVDPTSAEVGDQGGMDIKKYIVIKNASLLKQFLLNSASSNTQDNSY